MRKKDENYRKKDELDIVLREPKKSYSFGMESISIRIYYKKPYNWKYFLNFKSKRLLKNIEWISDNSYGCNFSIPDCFGSFNVHYVKKVDYFTVDISISNIELIDKIIVIIKRMLDTDRNINPIEKKIKTEFPALKIEAGIKNPGALSFFEAGMRATCGQQVSIKGATSLLNRIIEICDKRIENLAVFPEPIDIVNMNFDLLKTMQSKKNTLKEFALWCYKNSDYNDNPKDIEQLLSVKGIGAWTVNYIKMRAISDSNVWIKNDLGIKKALKKYGDIDPKKVYPWATYLSLHLLNNLNI